LDELAIFLKYFWLQLGIWFSLTVQPALSPEIKKVLDYAPGSAFL
jgi:hypothetical protein